MTTTQIIVILVLVSLGAALKSTSGIGMPVVYIPAISYVASIEEAVIIGALSNLVLPLGSRVRSRLSTAHFDHFVLALPVLSAVGLGWRTLG